MRIGDCDIGCTMDVDLEGRIANSACKVPAKRSTIAYAGEAACHLRSTVPEAGATFHRDCIFCASEGDFRAKFKLIGSSPSFCEQREVVHRALLPFLSPNNPSFPGA